MKIEFNIERIFKFVCAVLLVTQLFFIGLPDQASNTAMAQGLGPCVVGADLICTRDINECGNPSICQCPDGYSYDASVGDCLIDDVYYATEPGKKVDSKCALPPDSLCTRDINECGNPSICICPEGSIYSPIVGNCLLDLSY